MSRHPTVEELGEPALQVSGFQLWVHGYQFPDLADYWDGNWLRVTAHCGGPGASVWTSGAILRNVELLGLAEGCNALREGQAQRAELAPLEPDLKLSIEPRDRTGHFSVVVEITPDHLTQQHSFEFEIDQTYLPGIARMCRAIVEAYPVRGEKASRGV